MGKDDVATEEPFENNDDVDTAVQINKDIYNKKYSKYYKESSLFDRIAYVGITHLTASYGLYLAITATQWKTNLFATLLYVMSCYGITVGAHRLWSHRAYKATWQFRLLLVIFNSMAFHYSVLDWSRNHRLHHKYVETNADPHNAKRGLFFSHVGWLLVQQHPDVRDKEKTIDVSDLHADPLVMFQQRHWALSAAIFCYIIPTVLPVYFWNETWSSAFFVAGCLRQCASLHAMWSVNSFAHLFGAKPYDKNIYAAENLFASSVSLGEGWHNYHHVFPWDYKASEMGSLTNSAASFIDFFAKIGWAYELKSASPGMIQKRVEKTGDGSHDKWGKNPIWGWGDKDQSEAERREATVLHSKKR